MYSILQPKSDVANVKERFIQGSSLSAVLRTNAMFLTNGILKFVKLNRAATTPATAAIVLTIKRIISAVSTVSSFVGLVFRLHRNHPTEEFILKGEEMKNVEKEKLEVAEYYRLGQDDFKRGIPMKTGIERARKMHQREAYARGFRDAFLGLIGATAKEVK